MTTTPARDARLDRIAEEIATQLVRMDVMAWLGTRRGDRDHDEPISQQRLAARIADAVAAADQAHAAEVRAAAFDEAEQVLRSRARHTEDGCDFCNGVDFAADTVRDLAAAAPETEAHPARHRWAVETRDPGVDEWVPGHRFLNRHHAVDRLAALTENHPVWYDGAPAQRRLVRETTTHTVEPTAAARPDTTGA